MGRRAQLTIERIVNEAIALIDDAGLHAFSMRALAGRLGVDPMAVYHHLPSREAVLDVIVEELMSQANLPTESPTWQEWVRVAAARFVDLADAYPRAFPLIAIRGPANPQSLVPLEALADALRRGGFRAEEVYELVQMFSNYAVSLATQHLDAVVFGSTVGPAVITADQLPRDAFPRFFEADRSNTTPRSIFERGLEAMIVGLESELERRRT